MSDVKIIPPSPQNLTQANLTRVVNISRYDFDQTTSTLDAVMAAGLSPRLVVKSLVEYKGCEVQSYQFNVPINQDPNLVSGIESTSQGVFAFEYINQKALTSGETSLIQRSALTRLVHTEPKTLEVYGFIKEHTNLPQTAKILK